MAAAPEQQQQLWRRPTAVAAEPEPEPEPEPEQPRPTLLGRDRNSVLAAIGAVTITGTIMSFQYAVFVYLMMPAALEEGDLPFIDGS